MVCPAAGGARVGQGTAARPAQPVRFGTGFEVSGSGREEEGEDRGVKKIAVSKARSGWGTCHANDITPVLSLGN